MLGEVGDFNYLYSMKKCTKCQETKELTKFVKRTDTKDGLNSWCKSCVYQKSSNYEAYKESIKRNIVKYHNKLPPGIYLVKNLNTGDYYIGQSKTPIQRVMHHLSYASKLPWLETISKTDHLIWGIIEHCTPDKLLEREKYWINKLKPKYNA